MALTFRIWLFIKYLRILNFDFKRRSGDVIVAPFHYDDVITSIPDDVADMILIVARMLYEYLFAGTFRPVDTDE